jgi:defect-in-organelle-trafficking protein DotD
VEHRSPFPPIASLLAALLVVGCAAPNVGTDVAMTGMPNTELALRDSMRVVDAEMGKLGVLGTRPRIAGPIVPGELQRVVAFSYTGTLEDGVRQLAGNVGYTVAVSPPPSGQAPAQVAVATGPVPIIQAFQALGEAAGTRVMVTVDPARRQVEVAYRA